ncbi:ATP synthase B/B' CF family protein [Orientia chuto str. Dubai]|uniref:ATP synthase B/B' CF family protein n=1 Tax=Orientia chuto str. Dubai TaxID=1359168 RepID=A0A0F3MJU5_9RICK|nr:ATP synthase subunit B [Candidatus Orientia mediorientalis]KJV55727.1 ATP synthase B/B' CF family protein [Orientia chuto str. Dubai]
MPQLDYIFFPTQLFWLAITFTFLLLIINFIIVPLAENIFTRRNNYISSYIEKAKKINLQVQQINEEIDKITHLSELEAEEIIRQAKKSSEEICNQKWNHHSKQLDQKIANCIAEIENMMTNFQSSYKEQVIQYSQDLIKKLTNHEADVNYLYEYYNKLDKKNNNLMKY